MRTSGRGGDANIAKTRGHSFRFDKRAGPLAGFPSWKGPCRTDRFVLQPAPSVEVALVAKPPSNTFERLPKLKFVQSLWMGVEHLLANRALPRHVPVARLLDPGMIAAMTETVLAHVLDWHRLHFRYRAQQAERIWEPLPQVLAAERHIGILGLGQLGSVVAQTLYVRGFRVLGWSRRQRAGDRRRMPDRVRRSARAQRPSSCACCRSPRRRAAS
jgi:phosphoglycerate dehydrogenase-like enzyme